MVATLADAGGALLMVDTTFERVPLAQAQPTDSYNVDARGVLLLADTAS